jgi:adenine phosphoribosyltransferase
MKEIAMTQKTAHLAELINHVPDFPVPGREYLDITPLLQTPGAFREVIDTLAERYTGRGLDAIVGLESRGFLFSAPLAYRLGVSLIPARKLGNLPRATYSVEYEMGVGKPDKLEIHRDAITPGARVLVVDDLLASGLTLAAACELVEMAKGVVEEVACLIELTNAKGRERLAKYEVFALIEN